MKTNVNKVSKDSITIFRYKMEDLEQKLVQEHEAVKNGVAIPLGKDLAAMSPSKPEPDCERDVYSGVISGAYSKMMMTAKKELQSEIESYHMVSDKTEAEEQLKALSGELEQKETDLRLKKRELEKCDSSLLKKAQRYQWTRLALIFLVLVDMLLSGTALQSLGYPLIVSYTIGLAIGVGIFFLAENLPEIIAKGRTIIQRWIIAITVFTGLFAIFYVLGIFRSTAFVDASEFKEGINPLYFASLNMFFSIIATLVVYFRGLKKSEKRILDQYRLTKEQVDSLTDEIKFLKENIQKVRKAQAESELARRQIQIYAHDIQELVQRLYEESQKTFYSTNCIHRSDGRTPKFFEYDIPQLPSFYRGMQFTSNTK
ncbi:MAG TPA: hypothetical protein PKH16_00055 [Aequorivita sp.]|nr:hypothetical protein [Aequorivita sp.]